MNSQILKSGVAIALGMLLLQGCASSGAKNDELSEDAQRAAYLQPVGQEVDPVAPMTLRVIGYGAIEVDGKKTDVQRRLLAMRAAKMDAYRTMAERVYGMTVQGSTTVRDMVVQSDRFRSYVETYMHGARVVSTDVMADGSVETVLEMVIDQGFRNCLQTQDNQRFNVDCRTNMAGSGNNQLVNNQRKRVQNESTVPESSFYFIE